MWCAAHARGGGHPVSHRRALACRLAGRPLNGRWACGGVGGAAPGVARPSPCRRTRPSKPEADVRGWRVRRVRLPRCCAAPPGRSPCPGVGRAGGGGIAAGAGGDRVGAPARAAAGSLVGGGHRRRQTPPLAVCRRRLRSPRSAGRVAPPPLGWPPPWAARARCWWRRGRGGTRPRPSTPPFAFGWGGGAEWVRGETRTAFCVVFFFCGGGRRDVWMAILTAGSYAFRRSSSLFISFLFSVFDAFLDRAWHAPLRVMAGVWWAQASSCRW